MSILIQVRNKMNIHLIGAGGTGGYALSYLVRLLSDGEHVIHVYDGDRVEPKNLKRQNFDVADLDENKAAALCRRLKESVGAPGVELIPHEDYLGSGEDLMMEILTSLEEDQSLVILLAVDNVATRKLVNEVILKDLVTAGILTVAIDSGNDNQGGQVALYANARAVWKGPFGEIKKGMLPSMLQIFPELGKIEDVNPAEHMDCAENAQAEPQAMMANVRNGELMALAVARLLETHRSPGNLWKSDILTGKTTCSFTGFLEGER